MTIKISNKAILVGCGILIGGIILPRFYPNSKINRIKRYGNMCFYQGVEFGLTMSGLKSIPKIKD